MMNTLLKLVDLIVYLGAIYLAFNIYSEYVTTGNSEIALQYDLVYLVVLLYTMGRRPDVNTITLALAVLLFRLVDTILLSGVESLGGFINYSVLLLMNIAIVAVIWLRPLLFSRIWPWKGNSNFAVTHQDNVLATLFSIQVIFMFLLLLEHASRRINEWMYENSRILYNNFELIQFALTIAVFFILYYMTHDKAKAKRPDRAIG